jgi:hypothetical protein
MTKEFLKTLLVTNDNYWKAHARLLVKAMMGKITLSFQWNIYLGFLQYRRIETHFSISSRSTGVAGKLPLLPSETLAKPVLKLKNILCNISFKNSRIYFPNISCRNVLFKCKKMTRKK